MNIQDIIKKVQSLGFTVYVPKDAISTYFYYTDGTNVAYLQINNLTKSIHISTVHHPNKESGTGYEIYGNDEMLSLEELTAKHLKHGFITKPDWALLNDGIPQKYTLETWKTNSWSGKNTIKYTNQ
jgi:hypothetical protein